MLKLALVLCVVLLAYLVHTAAKPRPVQLLDYERTTDDRSVAYVQFQASLKDANEPRADGILAYYDALEVMGLGIAETRATAVVAAYLPDAPRAALADRLVNALVSAGALQANLLETVEKALEDGGNVAKPIIWLCCGVVALRATTTPALQRHTERYINIVAFWEAELLKVEKMRVYGKWPTFGLKQCTYAHAVRTERLASLTKRHARRLQGIMRPPRREMVVSIDDHKVRTVLFPVDILEWNALVGTRLVALKRQRSMGMPALPVELLNLYEDRCASGYDFEDKPLLMLETVDTNALGEKPPRPAVDSSMIYPHDKFSAQFHVHEIICTGCTCVSAKPDTIEALCTDLLRELYITLKIPSGPERFLCETRHRPVGAVVNSKYYTESGLLGVFCGEHCEFVCRRGIEAVTTQTSAVKVLIVAGELLAMMSFYGERSATAGLLTHTVHKDTTLNWVTISPELPFSVRGYSIESIKKNIRTGRPYSTGPW